MTEPHPHHPLALTDQARTLTNRALEQFRAAVSENQPERPEIPNSLKLSNEDRIRQTLTELESALAPWRGRAPEDLSSRELDELEAAISGHLLALDESRCLFDEPFLAFFIDQGYLQAARAFFLQVRREDPNLSNPEIFQALRNVWIMNSLQLYFHLPLAVSPAVYGYSLLYPYTDNFLDDPAVSAGDKALFNDLISRALDGQVTETSHADARRAQELITGIHGQFDPAEQPQVLDSIRLIQAAQIRSLAQDGSDALSREALLELSFAKGGASVLADAFLVRETLDASEQAFAFFYGSFLQLVDDLQDAREDRSSGHQTLFSTVPDQGPLDAPIRQLMAFIAAVNQPQAIDSDRQRWLKRVIAACSHLMILDVLGRDPELVSPEFYGILESTAKVRLSFFRELAERLDTMSGVLAGAIPSVPKCRRPSAQG